MRNIVYVMTYCTYYMKSSNYKIFLVNLLILFFFFFFFLLKRKSEPSSNKQIDWAVIRSAQRATWAIRAEPRVLSSIKTLRRFLRVPSSSSSTSKTLSVSQINAEIIVTAQSEPPVNRWSDYLFDNPVSSATMATVMQKIKDIEDEVTPFEFY